MLPIRDNIPSRRQPVVTILLIAANVSVFSYELTLSPGALHRFFNDFGLVPARLLAQDPALRNAHLVATMRSVLTSMFLHGGWLHVIGNMWTLWIFGDNVEDRMGRIPFLAFFVLCGVAAGLTHLLTNLSSAIPTVGASGAVAGIMGAYFVLYPHARIVTLVPILFLPLFIELPAFIFLGLWFVTQLFTGTLSLAAPANVGGVAWWAHGGGFLAGVLLHRPFVDRRPFRRSP
jgi:membrane associated rhomboid family serine protease